MVNGRRRWTTARPRCNRMRARRSLQGISGFLRRSRTKTTGAPPSSRSGPLAGRPLRGLCDGIGLALPIRSPRPCHRPAHPAARLVPLPTGLVCCGRFQSPGLRKHPGVGLGPWRQRSALNGCQPLALGLVSIQGSTGFRQRDPLNAYCRLPMAADAQDDRRDQTQADKDQQAVQVVQECHDTSPPPMGASIAPRITGCRTCWRRGCRRSRSGRCRMWRCWSSRWFRWSGRAARPSRPASLPAPV